ncbi:mechanosensitive ion channel protein 10-like [Andrographis paniculata]|uniref:mechanosensitive ion channel protein 10-like n=1 Tax=Andrographis paniculata TaxID=175694 RepID=UPI0021E96E6C|nr:mechanosensitive ion channel protein 10-like [Andrographis paniculata]XP_051119170.1 mechanosensitive ion channel protein 10-like [Andrographis paniculata]XP_051119172.1 mechanosensitive ion channel protein 10-like [Andrographis paniculata]XP_051119173.1 mechanosensitive ion channel protein 10-like [Andrographis paniculata]XP_051119174.1 mechanosensitive ion channel protein 10-like [Andrographis paniculata]
MEAKYKSTAEISMTENQKSPSNHVVVHIPASEKEDASKEHHHKFATDSPQKASNDSTFGPRSSATPPATCASPETSIPSSNKPPKIPTASALTKRKSLSRSVYSKPKSRFGEQSVEIDAKMFDESPSLVEGHPLSSRGSPVSKLDTTASTIREVNRTVSITPRTPLMSSPGGLGRAIEVDEGEEIYKRVSSRRKLKHRRVKTKVLVEWLLFLSILGCLIASLTVDRLKGMRLWSLKIWKWCVLVLVTFSGLLVTKWLVHFAVLLIELNYMLKKKVLYFVYGLKGSVRVFIWLAVVLFTKVLLLQESVERSELTIRVLKFITWTITSLLIGSFLWLLKNLLLKILASSFHVNTFFDRIQESINHQYILLTLSGPPLMDSAQMLGKTHSDGKQFSFGITKKIKEGKEKGKDKEKEVIDIHKLLQMKRGKVSAWTMKMLIEGITNSGFTTITNVIDENAYGGGNEQMDKEITNEEEAIAAAYYIFRNVAQPGCNYIDEYDLRRFMIREEVEIVFPMIDVAETGQIDRKALTEWVVKVYKSRKALAHALTDTKTAVKQLNKLVTGILIVIIIIIWLLVTGIATTKVLVFLSSQILVAGFVFSNTCKTIFEAIIFVFVMHPFDVGDRCVIDGVQMIVEEMNILTTVLLKADNEKVFYPNSVLATKAISNYYRSPDMGDSFEFCIDFRTPMEKIGGLKEKIKKYLEKNPHHWHPNHNVVVKEIENINKIKMAVFINHTMNFQDFPERNRRRTEFVLEMKRIFEELSIRYDLLPQEVHLFEKSETSK